MVSVIAAGVVVAVSGGPAAAASVPTGAVSLESVNYPGRYVRHLDFLGRLDPVTPRAPPRRRRTPPSPSSTGSRRRAATRCRRRAGCSCGTGTGGCGSTPTPGTRRSARTPPSARRTVPSPVRCRSSPTTTRTGGSGTGTSRCGWTPTRTRRRSGPTAPSASSPPWAPKTTKNPVLPGLFADPHIAASAAATTCTRPPTATRAGAARTTRRSPPPTWSHWTDHGVILDLGPDVSWADNSAWAPAIAEQERAVLPVLQRRPPPATRQALGVAVSDSPTGPFRDALGTPLVPAGSSQAARPSTRRCSPTTTASPTSTGATASPTWSR